MTAEERRELWNDKLWNERMTYLDEKTEEELDDDYTDEIDWKMFV